MDELAQLQSLADNSMVIASDEEWADRILVPQVAHISLQVVPLLGFGQNEFIADPANIDSGIISTSRKS